MHIDQSAAPNLRLSVMRSFIPMTALFIMLIPVHTHASKTMDVVVGSTHSNTPPAYSATAVEEATNNSATDIAQENEVEQHLAVIDTLAAIYQDKVPVWAKNLTSSQFSRLIEQSFFENGRSEELAQFIQVDTSSHYRALLGKYLEYQTLADSGYWCSASLSSAQTERIAYLLWLQGDLNEQQYTLNDSISLCTAELKTVSEVSSDQIIGETLSLALKRFQARHKIPTSGTIDTATMTALRTPVQNISWDLKNNLQRMASINTDDKNRYIIANIPAYDLTVYEDDKPALQMQTIVGKRSRKTPELSLELKTVVINPTWNVPAKLAYRDLIPKQIKDPQYLNKKNIRIYSDWQSTETIDPASIDWLEARHNFPYRLKQEAGDSNALGKFKFIMPNPRAIYLHDTNSRYLFKKTRRTYSSGCIRVSKPKELALFLLQDSRYGTEPSIDEKLISGKTRYIKLPESVPVHVVYWTNWVDADGILQSRSDVYRYNPQAPTNSLQYAGFTQ